MSNAAPLTYSNSLLPYFYSPIAAAAQAVFADKMVVGGWDVWVEYPGYAQIQMQPDQLIAHGKAHMQALVESSDVRTELTQLATQLQQARAVAQNRLRVDLQKEVVSELDDFYPEATRLIAKAIGIGFSVEQYLGSKGLSAQVPYLTWAEQERRAFAKILELALPEKRQQRLAEHVTEYSWIANDWSGVTQLSEADFLYRNPGASHGGPLAAFDLSRVPTEEAGFPTYMAALRDERTAYERIVVSLLDRYLHAECQRLGISPRQAVMCTVSEFERDKEGGLSTHGFSRGMRIAAEGVNTLSEQEWLAQVGSVDTTLRGESLRPGYVMGTARVVHSRRDFNLVREGDILIAAMTRPEYGFVLGKCAGVIVSESGAASHAEEVAARYSIPVVQGVSFATAVFRDGDLLELDATLGVVRRIKAGKHRPKDVRGSRLFG